MLIVAQFTQGGGAPATGLALADVDLYLWQRNKATGVVTPLWAPENPTAEVGTAGQYIRDYPGDGLTTYDYFAFAQYTGVAVLDNDYSYQGGLPSECVSRTLAATYTQLKAAMEGNDVDIWRGDTLDLDITRLGDLTGRDKLWFTVKSDKDDLDPGALIQIEETAGLEYIAGTAATVPANGSIVVTDAVRGSLTVTLAAEETAKLEDIGGHLYWDVQMLSGTVIQTLNYGRAKVIGDVTRVVS